MFLYKTHSTYIYEEIVRTDLWIYVYIFLSIKLNITTEIIFDPVCHIRYSDNLFHLMVKH